MVRGESIETFTALIDWPCGFPIVWNRLAIDSSARQNATDDKAIRLCSFQPLEEPTNYVYSSIKLC